MKLLKKALALLLTMCIAGSVFVGSASAASVDVKNAVTLGKIVSSTTKTLDVNFKIPAGLSKIQGIEFKIDLPTGFTAVGFNNSISKFDVTFKNGKYVAFDKDAATALESAAKPVNGVYKLGSIKLSVASSVAAKNYSAKITVTDISATNGGSDAISNIGKTGVNYTFTYCKHASTTTKVTKATTKAAGKVVKTCKVCGAVVSTKKIYRIKTVKLSSTSYTYNGKSRKPSVTVKNYAGKKLVKNTDFTVKYAGGRKKVGAYKVTVTFKGNYSGKKSLTFKINPKGVKLSKLTAGKKQLKVKWKKGKSISGYQVRRSLKKSMKSSKSVTVKKYKTTSTTIKKLKAKKTYYVQVRTYKTVKGKKYYSTWSKAMKKKTK